MKSVTTRRFVEAAETALQRAGGGLDLRLSGTLAAGFDIALVLDRMGIVQDLAILSEDLVTKPLSEQLQAWQGHAFSDLVLSESRTKAIELMRVVAIEGHCKPRQLNFSLDREGGLILSVAATKLEHEGKVLLLCRDLRPMSRLQQQLIEAQQKVEREYSRQRSIETRQQALFQLSSEGMLVVDEGSLRVLEANPAATELLNEATGRKSASRERITRTLPDYLEGSSKTALVAWLARIAREPSIGVFEGTLKASNQSVIIRASLVRQNDGPAFMVTIRPSNSVVQERGVDTNHQILSNVFDGMPDAFVVSDSEGRVLFANQSFVELVQFATQEQVRGASLSKWFSRAEVDLSLLLGTLKQHGVVRQYATDVRGEFGSTIAVEIAGVMRSVNGQNCFGFAIRDVVRRPVGEAENDRFMPRSNDELRELVGRVPLKDIVAETSDLIERLCIETALELTGDNRAAAAEMLGLSRQSLYVKLRRFGVGYDESGELVV